LTGSSDSNDNWLKAESYFKKFYGNIEKAINGDKSAKEELREAFLLSEDRRYGCSITDCFEALALVYFVVDFDVPKSWTACV
jgi:hypothetical protein